MEVGYVSAPLPEQEEGGRAIQGTLSFQTGSPAVRDGEQPSALAIN